MKAADIHAKLDPEIEQALSTLLLHRQWTQAMAMAQEHPQVLRGRFHCFAGLDETKYARRPFLNHAAVFAGAPLVQGLLQLGAPLEGRSPDGRTPLLEALSRNARHKDDTSAQIVDVLIAAGARLDNADNTGECIIYKHPRELRPALVQHIIAAGARLDTLRLDQGKQDRVPSITHLVREAVHINPGYAPQTLDLVVRSGVNLNPWAATAADLPLAPALEACRLDLAEMLVSHGADCSARAADGRSLMFVARSKAAVQWLLERDATLVNACDHKGISPLHQLIVQFISSRVLDEAFDVTAVSELIIAGADLDAVDHQGPLLSHSPRRLIGNLQDGEVLQNLVRTVDCARTARGALQEFERTSTPRP